MIVPRSRLLAVAILIVLVAAAGFTCTELYTAHAGNRHAIRAKEATLGRLNAVVAQSDAVDQWTSSLSQGLDDGAFLPGDGDAVSSADLQARLLNITSTNGASMSSFRAMDPEPREGLVDVGVEIALQGTYSSVERTISTIESSLPLLFLTKATFRNANSGDTPPNTEVMLEVTLEIYGYARNGGAAASGS